MRTARFVFWFALLGAFGLALTAPTPVYAQDGGDDEFETSRFGVKLGIWYRPTMEMNVQVAGGQPSNPLLGLIGSDFDIHRELGVAENVYSEWATDFDREAIPELTVFFETRWISLYVWAVPTFEYRGNRTLTKDIQFGGQTFTASTPIESNFRQFYGAADVAINIFNNRYFRVSPMVGVQVLGIDWQLKAPQLNLKADTSSIGSPASWAGYELFPNPEAGLSVAVGYRDFIEVSATVMGAFVSYNNIEGSIYRLEANVTVYPIPWVGVQVGVRHSVYDVKAKDSKDPKTSFDFNMEFTGLTAGIIVRI